MGASVINVSSIACVAAAAALDDRALGAALAYAVDVKNVVVVAAAGNVGGLGQCPDQNPPADPARPGQPDWESVKVVVSPAWYDDYVLTVGSVDQQGAPSRFTLAGPWVDVAAPGEGVVSLDADGEGLVDSLPVLGSSMPIVGTSYAAPVVSGIAALVRARSPHLTARQVMQRIKDTAHRPPSGWDPFVGNGVVDALAAVSGGTTGTNDLVQTNESSDGDVRPMSPPASESQPDPSGRRIAFGGAGVCVAVVAAAVAMTASVGRSTAEEATLSRATSALSRLSSGPRGSRDSTGHGAATGSPCTPRSFAVFVIMKAEKHSAVRHQIQRTGVAATAGESRRPHIRASS